MVEKSNKSNIIFSHGTSTSRGVCIILRRSSDIKLIDTFKDNAGRFLLIKVEIYKKIFVIANIYAPNNEKDQVDVLTNVHSALQDFNR